MTWPWHNTPQMLQILERFMLPQTQLLLLTHVVIVPVPHQLLLHNLNGKIPPQLIELHFLAVFNGRNFMLVRE